MTKERDPEPKDGKDAEADTNKEELNTVTKGPIYTGDGFIPIEELIDNVKAWQQRKVLSEDVDYLEKKGGRCI